MDRHEIQSAFTVLKPCCDALMKNPNVENARKVAATVTTISEKVIQDLLEYILFPFTVHLENNKLSDKTVEELMKTVDVILSRARVKTISYFKKLYSCLLIKIYDQNQSTLVIPGHEELKEAVLHCVRTLIHSCFTEVIETLYTKEEAPRIGQGILLSITMARLEKSRSLRLIAIDTLMALCQVDDKADKSDIILQDQVADVIMLYFPGVISGLQEIAMGSEVQGHKLTMMALRAWGKVISLVMHDKDVEETKLSLHELMKSHETSGSLNPLLESPFMPKDPKDLDKFLKEAVRSPQWFQAAALKLNVPVRKICVLKNHSHHKVRLELARSIDLVLSTCSWNMKPNVNLLIEYLIALSEDDVEEVSEEAKKALNAINKKYTQDNNMKPLYDVLEENFYNLLTRLPRVIRTSNDSEQLSCLNEVAGYLKLLGEERLPRILQTAAHIQKLILALIYVIEIDNANVSLLRTVNVKDFDDPAYTYGPHFWRRFRFLQSKPCEEKLRTICRLIGQFGDTRMLVDFITTFITDTPQFRRELILLLTWIADASSKKGDFSDVHAEIIEFFISDDLWYPPIEVSEDTSLRQAQNNVVQCCLLMEGVSLLIQNTKYDCKKLLSKIVYKIMERVGSDNSLISFVAADALEKIAESHGYQTVGGLLQNITDYLSYSLLIRLRRVHHDPGVLDVIVAVMKYSSMDVLPCMQHLLQLIFNHLKNDLRKEKAHAYIKIFYTFAICVKKLANCKDICFEKKHKENTESESSQVIQALLEYYEAKQADKLIDDDGDVDTEEIDREIEQMNRNNDKTEEKKIQKDNSADKVQYVEFDSETGETKTTEVDKEELSENFNSAQIIDEKQPELPPYVKPIEDVAKHCLNLIPSKDVQTSLTAMVTLIECVTILSQWEDHLLPLVHLIWSPLVEKFRKMDKFHEENVIIMNRAWQLFNVLAKLSQDFIRSRTLKQIAAPLSKFLTQSAKESYKKGSQSIYRFTQVYKLQYELLSTLGRIAADLKFHEEQLWDILTVTEIYLDKYQNPVLQTCCVQLYKDIADYNGDIVWVKCLSIWHAKVSKIPCDASLNTADLKVPENARDNYHKNVRTILDYLQEKDLSIS